MVQGFWEITIGLYEGMEAYKEAVKNYKKEKGYFLIFYWKNTKMKKSCKK